MFRREAHRGARMRIVKLRRPAEPARIRAERRAQMPIEGVEARMQLQQLSARRDEAAERGGTLGAWEEMALVELDEQQPQDLELDLRHAGVVDEPALAQLAQAVLESGLFDARLGGRAMLELRHCRDRDVKDVEKMAARGAVRAGALGLRRRQSVQRIQADEARAPRRAPADQGFQILEISDAPVAPGAYGIELDGDAPQPSAAANGLGLVAVGRRDHQRTAARRARPDLDLELVSSGRELERQLQAAARDPGALDLPAPALRTIGGRHGARTAVSALEVHGPEESCAEVAGGDVEIDARARAVSRGNRGQERSP